MCNLCKEGADPDADEYDVSTETVEDVSLTVNLACVDLIEQRHHDERVEDDCEVLIGSRTQRLATTVHVE